MSQTKNDSKITEQKIKQNEENNKKSFLSDKTNLLIEPIAVLFAYIQGQEKIDNTISQIHHTFTDPDLRNSFSRSLSSEMDPSVTFCTQTDKKSITENLMLLINNYIKINKLINKKII